MSTDTRYDVSFNALVRVLERVEATSSRRDIERMLSEYLQALPVDILPAAIYLMQGALEPVYRQVPFQIARKTVDKIASRLLGVSDETFARMAAGRPDAAVVVREHMVPNSDTGISLISLAQVVTRLGEIVQVSGVGSTTKREDMVVALGQQVQDPGAIAFLLRIIQGTLRAGFSDMTLLQAIRFSSGADDGGQEVWWDKAYMRCADLGFLAVVARTEGIAGIHAVQVRPGIPIAPAAAERLHTPDAIIEKIGPCVAQPKLDGVRLQVHVYSTEGTDERQVRIFSRHLHEVTNSFPDIVAHMRSLPVSSVSSLICEGEAIASSFAQTVKRRRKHGVQEACEAIPLSFYVFDLLYLDGQEMLDLPHSTRRAHLVGLQSAFPAGIMIIDERAVTTSDDIQAYFQECLELGVEGLVVKKPDAPYPAGKRGFAWVKLKRHQENFLADTIDAVVLGYYRGYGRRAVLGIGAFLVGVYNHTTQQFQTIAKVGTGLDDTGWKDLKAWCDDHALLDRPSRIACAPNLYPDVWVDPVLVCEIAAEEITASPVHTARTQGSSTGLALRFPRFIRRRSDKSPFQTTTIEELLSLRASRAT